ncbi:MAG: SH3 domain-containing protein [Pseudomonadota bacterium]
MHSSPRPIVRASVLGCAGALAIIGTISTAQTPAAGEPRRWEVIDGELSVYVAPSKDAEVINVFPAGAILTNLGCTEDGGQIWCQVRPFRGGARGFAEGGSLRPAKGPDGAIPTGAGSSKQRARKRDFDAVGQIACAQDKGQAMGRCDAAVARGVGGDATVVVTFPTGFARRLFFVHGEFVRASATMSGVGTDIDWRLENAVHHLRVDDQRYELPDTLVFGD